MARNGAVSFQPTLLVISSISRRWSARRASIFICVDIATARVTAASASELAAAEAVPAAHAAA